MIQGRVPFDGRPAELHGPTPSLPGAHRLQMVGDVRLDNRRDLTAALDIDTSSLAAMTDADLALAAFVRWGTGCPRHLLGDWSIAVWNPETRVLFLARDQLGNTGLFYAQHGPVFAFASIAADVPHLAGVEARADDVWLAEYIAGIWTTDVPDRTAFAGVRQLLPGTCATITDRGIAVSTYWRMFESPPVRMRTDDDYGNALLSHLRTAVASRLPPIGAVGSTLSSGLDSGIVTVLAAEALQAQGRVLTAFTAVPAVEASLLPPRADEWLGAQQVAERWPNITHVAVRGDARTPVDTLRHALFLLKQPQYAVSNFGWIIQMLEGVRSGHMDTMLTGQLGNGSISWNGGSARTLGSWVRSSARALLHQASHCSPWSAASSIAPLLHPDLARATQIVRRARLSRFTGQAWPPLAPRPERALMLSGLASGVGPFWARLGSAHHLRVCDPTTDVRVVEFCAAIPTALSVRNGIDRFLLRHAAVGLLPDEIRLSKTRGRQGTDLAPRLLAHQSEVDAVIEDLRGSPVLNHDATTALWHRIQRPGDPEGRRREAPVLMRGLMAGLFASIRA